MKEPFFARKSIIGLPYALVILMLVFFFVPFAGRGARMALQKTENNVKDWLPDSFRETEELAWFAKRFVSEQFILATWQNCTAGDQRYRLFVEKLRAEQAPAEISEADAIQSEFVRAKQLGTEYALFVGEDLYTDWAGANEKWLADESGAAFYITPDGRLYRWNGNANVVGLAVRTLQRFLGTFKLSGQFVTAFGEPPTQNKVNPFYADPRLVTAPLFKKIETGPDLVEQLAGQNGSLATPAQPIAGRRDAINRLTGTLYGRAVPVGFSWLASDVPSLLTPEKLAELPDDWDGTWKFVVDNAVRTRFGGQLESFKQADPLLQAEVWHEFFDTIAVEEPSPQTCVVITLTDAARRNLRQVIGRGLMGHTQGRVFQLASESGVAPPPKPTTIPPPFSWLVVQPVVSEPTIHVGGPPVDNVAIDEEGTITLVRLIGYSIVLGLGLSLACLRSFKLMMIVFFVGGVSAVFSLGAVWWANSSVDAILLTMPSLVYVLGMSGAIHIVNYYRDIADAQGQKGAAETALRHAFVPCGLAAITTAIGLVSLCTSNILPIRKFGIFSAVGVLGTLVLLFLFLPAALTVFPPALRSRKPTRAKATAANSGFWPGLGAWIIRHHWLVNAACMTLLVVSAFGVLKIRTSVQLLKMFDARAQIIRDYRWLEEHFGRLVPMELIVRFPAETQRPHEATASLTDRERRASREQLSLLERAQAVARIQDVLQAEFGYAGQNIVGQSMSAITFLRDMPDPSRGFDAHRVAYDRLLQQARSQLLDTDYLRVEPVDSLAAGKELWRISLRLGALNDVDYGQFVTTLRKVVEPVVAAYRCRRQIIQQILQASGETSERLRGDVLVLGYPNPSDLAEQASATAQSATTIVKDSIDGERVFAQTLSSCLINETVRQTNWHDPVQFPLDEGKQISSKWGEYLRQFSCVVIMRDHADYDWEFIRQHNPHIIDVRASLREIEQPAADSQNELGVPVELGLQPHEVDVVYSGVVPVVYKAQRTLLESLIQSVIWAFVFIGLVMSLNLTPTSSILASCWPPNILQALGAGMVSMLPNVFPLVVVFGSMGFAHTLVDIGTMMTASVAMGIAVDDTIHFLAWFRQAMRDGLTRPQAIFHAYARCAPAMMQTTIVGGVGLSVFALSTFTPTQRFGTLMLTLLVAALFGDLVFLPALLASPLGRLFAVKPVKKRAGETGPSDQTYQIEGDPRTLTPFEFPEPKLTPQGLAEHPALELKHTEKMARREEPDEVTVQRPKMLRRDESPVRRSG